MLNHVLTSLTLLVEHSGIGQILLFLSITFFCVMTSRKGRKVLIATVRAIVAYQKATI